jgi:hypothetical protein
MHRRGLYYHNGTAYYIFPEVGTPFTMSRTLRGLPFTVQRNGSAMVWLSRR